MQKELESYFDRLWPICRSITGNGLRESLRILGEIVPLTLTEVPTGTEVFDWVVPKEWNIRKAYIITPDGNKIADFDVNNLHVVNYSIPVDKEITFEELKTHVHTIPEMPDAIPYVTSYYKETWGFCIQFSLWEKLPREGVYHVVIDSDLRDGHLTYGQVILPGESDEEILFSTYVCHPSMANNELSGPLAAAFLFRELAALPRRRFTYRLLLAPETIGVIAFLNEYGSHLVEKLRAGYVLTCCGDPGDITYKRSKRRTSEADRIAEHILKYESIPHRVIDFSVGGSDERQYCSPGFNLPVGSIMRTPYQQYQEYHTSLDDWNFIRFDCLEHTVQTCMNIVRGLELNRHYLNEIRYCEPQLGKRGLYPSSVDPLFNRVQLHRLLHLLSFADGDHDLVEIAEKRRESVLAYETAIADCTRAGLFAQQP